jgi:hypothetical protein
MAESQPQCLRRPWLHRLGWLVLLWIGGVVSMALLAGALRLLMAWAGMQR